MHAPATVDRTLLEHVSSLLLCSRCLRNGIRRSIVQIISVHHRPRALCRACREHDRPRR